MSMERYPNYIKSIKSFFIGLMLTRDFVHALRWVFSSFYLLRMMVEKD